MTSACKCMDGGRQPIAFTTGLCHIISHSVLEHANQGAISSGRPMRYPVEQLSWHEPHRSAGGGAGSANGAPRVPREQPQFHASAALASYIWLTLSCVGFQCSCDRVLLLAAAGCRCCCGGTHAPPPTGLCIRPTSSPVTTLGLQGNTADACSGTCRVHSAARFTPGARHYARL